MDAVCFAVLALFFAPLFWIAARGAEET